ncbi:MAG: ABC transporter ATP-binding protein [Acidobacteria bacterium]|nr:ABC transporter ATP-binding protein [Acidobacteriota bacterium]
MLQAVSLTFAYDATRPVLAGVSLEVSRGAIVGILGPNGSGKTTLLGALGGTRRPTGGTVTLDGRPLAAFSRRGLASRIAVVPQETHLAFEYTVLEMVLMGRHPHLGLFEVEGPADVATARDALAAVNAAHLEERDFMTLSGGEKQRVVIAAALAQATDVLLLDEPTSSLDLGAQLDIAQLLGRLNAERGVTIVVSTHDLALASGICRELVLLRHGRVVAAGPTAAVLSSDNVRALYDVDADVHLHAGTGHLVVVPLHRRTP